MISKSSTFIFYKPFIDAFMKSHLEVATSLRHYNALAEWDQIKSDENVIKSKIAEYSSIVKKCSETPSTTTRKRTMSSDEESEIHDPLFDPDAVIPVTPTFSKRTIRTVEEENDPGKPWVIRSLEKSKARVEAHLAKIEAKRLAKETRVKAPVQEAVIRQIEEISERIENLMQVKSMGLSTDETNYTLKRLTQQKKEKQTELSLLKSKQRAGLRYRARRKKRIESLCATDPEVATELLKIYKPTTITVQIDDVCPNLLNTIEEIARIGGVPDTYVNGVVKRCSSLDELRQKIKERGFEIRRSALFYRLIPAGSFSDDGKKHLTAGPVRLRKLQGFEQKKHPDCFFVSAILRHVRDLAGTFGNDCVLYLVQDSKASIRIGRQIGRGHSPLIMHLDYQMSSIDSTPMPPTVQHQLKPIVYASCLIDETGVVTSTGPTYVSIRSVKHDRIDIDCDEIDFDRVVKLKEFERTARNHIGEIKPIIVLNVDQINPTDYTRFAKTLFHSIKKFKKYNLDALIVISQAPGQSTFNVAERRLALLSRDLSGLVLPDYYFGTHLDLQGMTIDAELEKENFKRTGDVLAEIWNMNMIDRQAIVAEYIDPPSSIDDLIRSVDCQFTLLNVIDQICDEDEEIPLHQRLLRSRRPIYPMVQSDAKAKPIYPIDEYWCATHVFQTQYTIQIIRCTKTDCCGPWRSNYIQVFPHRFLPPPVPFHRSSNGVRVADMESSFADRNEISPYYGTLYQRIQFHGIVMRRTQTPLLSFDAFCPSIQHQLSQRICSICKQYIPLALRLRNHYKVHQQRYALGQLDPMNNVTKKEEEIVDDDDPIDPTDLPIAPTNFSQGSVFLFNDFVDWLKSDFEDDVVVETKQKSTAANAMAMIRKEKQMAATLAAATTTTNDSSTQEKEKVQQESVESVATISVDVALSSSSNEIIPLSKIKVEPDCVIDAIEHLNVNDDENSSHSFQSDSYDDLSDLIDKI